MKHHIIVKWNEKVKDKKAILPDIKNIFEPIKEIEGIYNVEFIDNIVNRENRYDLMIRIEMEESALSVYDASAPHKAWKDKYSEYIESKAIFDSLE